MKVIPEMHTKFDIYDFLYFMHTHEYAYRLWNIFQ